jgi:uncharacterized damage-inducible protein DinB
MATQALGTDLDNREFFIRRWAQEYPSFVRLFKALPAGQLDYRPHPRSRSAGELVGLLVYAQKSCIELCKNKKSMYSGLRWQEPNGLSGLPEMIAMYETDHAEFVACLQEMNNDNWRHNAWLVRGQEEIMLKDTVGGLLWLALFDFIHHRGQLSTYVRPMGGKVPSIYGPSADEPV